MSRRRTRIFIFGGALILASLVLVRGLKVMPMACVLSDWAEACDPSRVDLLGVSVPRPVAVTSFVVIGALLGGVIGLALSRVSNRTFLATGLGVALGSAMFAMSRTQSW